MEELLILLDTLERLETSPFEAALTASHDDLIVARSREATLKLMRTFIGPQGVESLLNAGSPPIWLEELFAAEATHALELQWISLGDLPSLLKVMPWVRRLVPRLDEHGNPPTTSSCLLVPGNVHPIPQVAYRGELSGRISSQCEEIIQSAIAMRDAPDLIEAARRTRKFWHDMKRLAAVDGPPCAALWRAYTWAKRLRRPWATYLRTEWGVDVGGQTVAQPARTVEDELHCGLLVIAISTVRSTAEMLRVFDAAIRDRSCHDPCTAAYEAVTRVPLNGWVVNAAMMKGAPLANQRVTAGMSLAAHVLTKVSLGHSRAPTHVRGRPGKRLDDALHDIGHDDPSIPCAKAHEMTLIQELLQLVWTDPMVQEIRLENSSADSASEALLRTITNRLTNSITRKARARRRRRTADGATFSERREVGLTIDPIAASPDPLEELVAREEAEADRRLWQECLELIPFLPPRQREVAELKLVGRLSHPQIAAHLGITEGGSKANWSKARKNLRLLFRHRQEQFGDVA